MTNHSPDLLSKQLSKLQSEVVILEQKVFSRNAEVQAAQRKLDTLHIQINRETERLLAEQARIIKDTKESLSDGVDEQNAVLTELVQTIADLNTTKRQLEDNLNAARVEFMAFNTDISIAEERLTRVEIASETIGAEIAGMKTEKIVLEQDMSTLTAQIQTLLEEETTLKTRLTEQKHADTKANRVYETEIAKKKEEIRLLNVQLLEIRQDAERIQQEDMLVRDSLATWEKTLEERDQNLRIREQKVEQGEGKLIQNSNLLNL